MMSRIILIHFIFGLRPEIMRGVYLQQPASILAAKEMAEKLELTHQCTASHQTHTKMKKTNKAARQRGTQERRSGSWRKSESVQLKACQSQYQRQKRRPRIHSTRLHCSFRSIFRGELSGETWTGSCVEIPSEGSATGRQNRTIEETGFCRDCIFGGFDASEGDYVCRHH